MSKITTTHVYKVNGELVIADNVEVAVNIYREHLMSFGTPHPEIKSIILIEDDNIPPSSSALIREL